MKEAFEKIIEKLEDAKSNVPVNRLLDDIIKDKPKELGQLMAYNKSIEIVKQAAEEYNNGWIPCSERLPENIDFVLYANKDGEVDICSIEYFYDYMDRFTAWQQLPEPYQPNGE